MPMQSVPLTIHQISELPKFSANNMYKLHQWRTPKHGDTCHIIVASCGKSSRKVRFACNAAEKYSDLKSGRAKYRCPVCREYAVQNGHPIY